MPGLSQISDTSHPAKLGLLLGTDDSNALASRRSCAGFADTRKIRGAEGPVFNSARRSTARWVLNCTLVVSHFLAQ